MVIDPICHYTCLLVCFMDFSFPLGSHALPLVFSSISYSYVFSFVIGFHHWISCAKSQRTIFKNGCLASQREGTLLGLSRFHYGFCKSSFGQKGTTEDVKLVGSTKSRPPLRMFSFKRAAFTRQFLAFPSSYCKTTWLSSTFVPKTLLYPTDIEVFMTSYFCLTYLTYET